MARCFVDSVRKIAYEACRYITLRRFNDSLLSLERHILEEAESKVNLRLLTAVLWRHLPAELISEISRYCNEGNKPREVTPPPDITFGNSCPWDAAG